MQAPTQPVIPQAVTVPMPTPELPVSVPTETLSWWAQLKSHIASWFQAIPPYVSDILIFLPIGIIFGFCSKAFGRYFVIALVLTAAIFYLGDYFHIITFHKTQLQAMLGGNIHSFGDLMSVSLMWIRDHIPASIAAVIGFFIGWKLGA